MVVCYLLDMDELWVHLQKFDSGRLKWHKLSQFRSSEKQPASEKHKKVRMKNTANDMRIAACGIYVANENDDNKLKM